MGLKRVMDNSHINVISQDYVTNIIYHVHPWMTILLLDFAA